MTSELGSLPPEVSMEGGESFKLIRGCMLVMSITF